MRIVVLSFLFFVLPLLGLSQDDENPVIWETDVRQISDTEYELIIKGKIFEGWHVYSQFTAEGGSRPSEFTYKNSRKGL